IHWPAELARRDRAAGAVDRWRRDAHDAKGRREIGLGRPGQGGDAALAVDRAVDRFADREILGERAGERPDPRVAPILPRLDRQDLDLQDVAGLGIRDRNRAGPDMGAELWRHRLEDRAMIGADPGP